MTRSAICFSRAVKSTVSRNPAASPIGEPADLGDVLAAEEHGERLGLEAGALADRARHLAHEALVAVTAPLGVGLGVAALDERDDALEAGRVGAVAAVAVLVLDVDLVVLAVQQRLLGAGRQSPERRVHRELHVLGEGAHHALEVLGRAGALGPRRDGTLGERQVVVGHDELGVDLELGADAGALRAGAERAS